MYSSRYQSRWWKEILIIPPIIFILTQVALANDPVKLWGQDGIKIQPGDFFVTDGLGGVLVIKEKINTWVPPPGETGRGLTVQRIDANGVALWGEKGVYHTTGDLSYYPSMIGKKQIVSDMTGGIIILLRENGTDLYAQLIDATGIKRWGDKGVVVAAGCRNQECRQRVNPQIVSDGSGGGIIVWSEQGAIWAQRIDANGISLWALNGIQIKNTPSSFPGIIIISDEKAGAIIAWKEGWNLCAQRIDGDGGFQWHPDGIVVASGAGSEHEKFYMVEDGEGGALFAWVGSDPTNFTIRNIYAQKVNPEGINQWENRVLITANLGTQRVISMITDGDGGTIIHYNSNIQRVTASGTLLWGPDGFLVDGPAEIVNDGAGGAIAVWYTVEEVQNPWRQWIVYKAQRLSPDGTPMWAESGFEVSRSDYDPMPPRWAITDGYSGVIIGDSASYAQRINDQLPSLPTRTLLVRKIGSGMGDVSSNPEGLECGVGCFGAFNPGTQIALTPVAAMGSTFLGLDGDFDCSDGIVTLNENMICTARFEPEGIIFKPPEIMIDRECDYFGVNPRGESTFSIFGIQNSGEKILTIDKITNPSPPFYWEGGTCHEGEALSPGESCDVRIVFLPENMKPNRSSFEILSNDPEKPSVTIYLSGGLLMSEFPETIGNWKTSNISKGGDYSSIAIDPFGYPHLSYLDDSNPVDYVLGHAFFDGRTWHKETVDTGDVGWDNSMAIDYQGGIHIAYRSGTPSSLKYAYFDGRDWHIHTLEKGGHSTSIALGDEGHPHITHVNNANELRYARYDGAQWISETLASNVGIWDKSSIALTPSQKVHIVFVSYPNQILWVNNASGEWEISHIADGIQPSLALDSSANPHVVFHGAGGIVYSKYGGADWETQTIITHCGFGGIGEEPDLALDADDQPHITFKYYLPIGGYGAENIIYAQLNGENWEYGIIEYRKYHTPPSIALDPGGIPHITYAEASVRPGGILTSTLRYVYLPGVGLTLTKRGNGTGIVASSPPGINCGSVCKYYFEPGLQITLTALPDPDSGFIGWVGCPNPSRDKCYVLLNDHAKVTAFFSRWTLKVSKRSVNKATGTIISSDGKIDCGTDCVESYPAGTSITLRAISDPDSGFVGWTGCVSDPLDPAQCTVVLDKNIRVKAKFSKSNLNVRKLSVNKATGIVVSSDGKINCGIDCSESYPTGASVTLTAQPDPGSTFSGWSGACSGTDPICTVTLNKNINLRAKFAKF